MDASDPLGILSLSSRLRRRSLLVLKILGSCGLIGAVGIWILRSLDYDVQFSFLPSASAYLSSWLDSVVSFVGLGGSSERFGHLGVMGGARQMQIPEHFGLVGDPVVSTEAMGVLRNPFNGGMWRDLRLDLGWGFGRLG